MQFNTAGTYGFACVIHCSFYNMFGQITVTTPTTTTPITTVGATTQAETTQAQTTAAPATTQALTTIAPQTTQAQTTEVQTSVAVTTQQQTSAAPATTGSSPTLHFVVDNGFAWNPVTVDVAVGDIVVWNWTGNHNVQQTSGATCTFLDSGSGFDSGIPSEPGSFQMQFNEEGTFNYACAVHCQSFNMKGTINVGTLATTQAQTSAAPQTSQAAQTSAAPPQTTAAGSGTSGVASSSAVQTSSQSTTATSSSDTTANGRQTTTSSVNAGNPLVASLWTAFLACACALKI